MCLKSTETVEVAGHILTVQYCQIDSICSYENQSLATFVLAACLERNIQGVPKVSIQ